MLQVIQHQRSGVIEVADLPEPTPRKGGILVENRASLISPGTERASLRTAQASLVGKARERPDLVRQVIDSAKTQGVAATYAKVRNRLDSYKEPGYSCAGVVRQSTIREFAPGDRVACAGGGYAVHAEQIWVPCNLAVKLPAEVAFVDATFTTIGAVALQGVRQADVRLGERVVVIGLGLLGLLTSQLLRANGCRVFGLDISERNFALAASLGCDEVARSDDQALKRIQNFTQGLGADAVIITASTPSDAPLNLALEVARKKSRIVVVGDVGMTVPRSPFYEKELDLRISCSYGPGRYDPDYEEKGQDYPVAYVRWTENRNMQALVQLLADDRVRVAPLISHRFTIEQAEEAYRIISGEVDEPHLGIVLGYPDRNGPNGSPRTIRRSKNIAMQKNRRPSVAFIGAGNFAQNYLLPAVRKAGAELSTVVTSRPVNAMNVAGKFDFATYGTDAEKALQDDTIDAAIIATRHDTHASFAVKALRAGKHVFVEKPMALSEAELRELKQAHADAPELLLQVGFNRRFARDVVRARQEIPAGPKAITYRINAGPLAAGHWLHDPEIGGGRIIGEVCHFVDLCTFLTRSRVMTLSAMPLRVPASTDDSLVVNLGLDDGSAATITYLANGGRSLPKEYLELHAGGASIIIDDFCRMTVHKSRRRKLRKRPQDKGHAACMQAFLEAVEQGGGEKIPVDEAFHSTLVTFKILDALATGEMIRLDDPD